MTCSVLCARFDWSREMQQHMQDRGEKKGEKKRGKERKKGSLCGTLECRRIRGTFH